jgi:hypothetical protein
MTRAPASGKRRKTARRKGGKGAHHPHKEFEDIYWFLQCVDVYRLPLIWADDDGWNYVREPPPEHYAKLERRLTELLDWLWDRMDHNRVSQFAPLSMRDDATRAEVSRWPDHRSRSRPASEQKMLDLASSFHHHRESMSQRDVKHLLLEKLGMPPTARALKTLEKRIERALKRYPSKNDTDVAEGDILL